MDVSENSGTTKSSILIGFTIINHPFWGTPIFGNTHMAMSWVPVLWWKGYPGIFSPHTNTAIKELLGDDGEQMARAAMKAGFLRGEWNGMLIVRSSPEKSTNSCFFHCIISNLWIHFEKKGTFPSQCKESKHLVTWCSLQCSLPLQVEWMPLWQSCICRGHWYSIRKTMPRNWSEDKAYSIVYEYNVQSSWGGKLAKQGVDWISMNDKKTVSRSTAIVKSSQSIQMSLIHPSKISDHLQILHDGYGWWLWMIEEHGWDRCGAATSPVLAPARRPENGKIPNPVEWESGHSVDLWPKFFVVQNQIGIWHAFDMLCSCQKNTPA